MFLKPPGKDTKPVSNRSTKGAFSNKKPAKLVAFKKATSEEAPAPKEDTPFVVWMRKQPRDVGFFQQQVTEYLTSGPPYLGDSLWDSRDAIKELGGFWSRNPLKAKDCDDKSIKSGWWAAPTEAVLLKLLRMGRDGCGRRQWECVHLVETQLGMAIEWLRKFEATKGGPPQEAKQMDTEPIEEELPGDVTPPRPAAKRARRESPKVPQWIRDAEDGKHMRPWLPDPMCRDCGRTVCDQFLDCGCERAVWVRCTMCTHKHRVGSDDCCKCFSR